MGRERERAGDSVNPRGVFAVRFVQFMHSTQHTHRQATPCIPRIVQSLLARGREGEQDIWCFACGTAHTTALLTHLDDSFWESHCETRKKKEKEMGQAMSASRFVSLTSMLVLMILNSCSRSLPSLFQFIASPSLYPAPLPAHY